MMGRRYKIPVVQFDAARQPTTYWSAHAGFVRASKRQEWPIPFQPARVQSASGFDERGLQAQAVRAKWNRLVKKNAKKRDNFEKRSAKNGKHYFALLAHNGEIVGRSPMYAHARSRTLGFARL